MFVVAALSATDPEIGRKLGVLAAGAILVGLLFGLLPRARGGPEARLLFTGLGLLLALSLASIAWSPSAERSLDEAARILGLMCVLFLGAALLRRREWGSAMLGVVAGGAAVCVLAFVARVLPDVVSQPNALIGERLAYPLGYSNALAAWSSMTFVALIAWAGGGETRWERSLCMGIAPIVGACLYLTYARGGIVTVALGLATLLLLSNARRRTAVYALVVLSGTGTVVAAIRAFPEVANGDGAFGGPVVVGVALLACTACYATGRRWPMPTGAARCSPTPWRYFRIGFPSVIAALVVVAALAANFDADHSTQAPEPAPTDPAARFVSAEAQRPAYWSAALEAGAAHPVGGVGAGAFDFWWAREGSDPQQVRDAHSLYLEQFAELGVPGLIAALLIGFGVLWMGSVAVRHRELAGPALGGASAGMVFVAYLAFDWVWEAPAVVALASVFLVSSAASASVDVGRAGNGWRGRRRSQSRHRGVVVTLAVVAVAGLLAQIPGLVGANRIEASNVALGDLRFDRALELADEASRAAPWAGTPYVQLALVRGRQGDNPAAREAMAEAIDREPENFRFWMLLAGFEAELGDARAARRSLERAEALAPVAMAASEGEVAELRERISQLSD